VGYQNDIPKKKPWRKILYETQQYPDNYVDSDTFLIGLVQNANFIQYDFWTVVLESAAVSQQVTIVALFCRMFVEIWVEALELPFLLTINAGIVVVGYLLFVLLENTEFDLRKFFRQAIKILLVFSTVLALSPVLHTLTNSFSDDTIWSLTSVLLVIHLYFHDYGYINAVSDRFTAPVSVNAAIFASVCLASRLKNSLYVFVFISFAIVTFALFPNARNRLRRFSVEFHVGLTVLLFVLAACLIMSISYFIAIAYIVAIFSITFLGPYGLIFIQKYKNGINGPWDEAIVPTNDT
jgi:phosphatidylinositol glycan class C protein